MESLGDGFPTIENHVNQLEISLRKRRCAMLHVDSAVEVRTCMHPVDVSHA